MRRNLLLSLVFLLAACSPEEQQAPMVGGDIDQHGCKPSAGYRWCQSTSRCERPWELAEAKGFANTTEDFEAFCNRPN